MHPTKPWHVKYLAQKPSDDFIIPLWKGFKPKDFYFATSWESETVLVYIVPCDYYISHAELYYDSMPIVHLLPDYLEEISDCIYKTNSISQHLVHKDMLASGFLNNFFLQKYIDQRYGIGAELRSPNRIWP